MMRDLNEKERQGKKRAEDTLAGLDYPEDKNSIMAMERRRGKEIATGREEILKVNQERE